MNPSILGFDVRDDYEPPAVPAPCHKPVPSNEPDVDPLDAWCWDEAFADEKRDWLADVQSRIDLVALMGGPAVAAKQLCKDAEVGTLALAKCFVKKDPALADRLSDELGRNFLHVAATFGKGLAVAWVVKNGMDVNRKTTYGLTPLMCACAWGREVTALMLLDLGADPTARDRHGRSALSMASGGLRSVLVQHPAMTRAGRLAFGHDIDDQWVEHTAGLGDSKDAEQFLPVKGMGVSQKYNLCLRATVSNAAATT